MSIYIERKHFSLSVLVLLKFLIKGVGPLFPTLKPPSEDLVYGDYPPYSLHPFIYSAKVSCRLLGARPQREANTQGPGHAQSRDGCGAVTSEHLEVKGAREGAPGCLSDPGRGHCSGVRARSALWAAMRSLTRSIKSSSSPFAQASRAGC